MASSSSPSPFFAPARLAQMTQQTANSIRHPTINPIAVGLNDEFSSPFLRATPFADSELCVSSFRNLPSTLSQIRGREGGFYETHFQHSGVAAEPKQIGTNLPAGQSLSQTYLLDRCKNKRNKKLLDRVLVAGNMVTYLLRRPVYSTCIGSGVIRVE
eukprot:GEMP01038844.1.p1 GENE.GEMP01038844.1~~GEMP01038844.1.p1  ORF type:complete len:157 (-),score=5.95 GEMP01038844.1:333-803(-)